MDSPQNSPMRWTNQICSKMIKKCLWITCSQCSHSIRPHQYAINVSCIPIIIPNYTSMFLCKIPMCLLSIHCFFFFVKSPSNTTRPPWNSHRTTITHLFPVGFPLSLDPTPRRAPAPRSGMWRISTEPPRTCCSMVPATQSESWTALRRETGWDEGNRSAANYMVRTWFHMVLQVHVCLVFLLQRYPHKKHGDVY